MELSVEDIEKIIRTAHNNKVAALKIGDFEIAFEQKMPDVPDDMKPNEIMTKFLNRGVMPPSELQPEDPTAPGNKLKSEDLLSAGIPNDG